MTPNPTSRGVPHHLRMVLLSLATVSVLLVAATVHATLQYRNSTQWVEQDHIVAEKAAELLSTVKDAETSQRGYLLTGQPEYLSPFLTVTPGHTRRDWPWVACAFPQTHSSRCVILLRKGL
jgi:CHASE3 domain sensor protein